MELLHSILQKAILLGATDIHLAPDQLPVYRISRVLNFDNSKNPLTKVTLERILEYFYSVLPNLENTFTKKRQADFSYSFMEHRFRINVSLSKGVPTFSFRIISNKEIDVKSMDIRNIINKLKTINSGMILVTGKVNSGKSTTMNAFIQEINKEESKKIVMLEDPIEYVHKSEKSIIIQKEIGSEADVITYHDGLINLLREDADIAVLGEIRDRQTMEVAIELSESGGLVIGTLHTRSCGETIERIINMYDPAEQMAIKNSLSTVLKMVVSQKLIVNLQGKLQMVPEVMIVNSTIAAQIRQEKFNVADIEDTIHALREIGCISYESTFADLYLRGLVNMEMIRKYMDANRIDFIKNIILSSGAPILDDVVDNSGNNMNGSGFGNGYNNNYSNSYGMNGGYQSQMQNRYNNNNY